MTSAWLELGLFAAKSLMVVAVVLLILMGFFALLSKGKEKVKGRLVIKYLNKKYAEMAETILAETLPKKQFKQFLKKQKAAEKAKQKNTEKQKTVYVLQFNGDIKASTVSNLSEEITAVLQTATPEDEVVLKLESAGGVVHGYGLAAAQLMRLRAQHIPLTITVDKIAASGGYLMACVANKILAAPFAIIGSIGVIVQLPNFHRVLKEKHIDFEQLTAGEFKRTLTVFGENTPEGREKLHEELETIHHLFKNIITTHRPQVDIAKVATGEIWPGQQALSLKLADELKISDDYLFELSKHANLYEICYQVKKSFFSKFSTLTMGLREKFPWL